MTKARSNATANAAKGDLTVGNGTNLSGVLAVGSNGDTIVADSSTSTGLRYNPQNALVNPVINGGMDIWQRGTSIAMTGSTYGPDRWLCYRGASGSTVTRQTVSDTTNLPNIQYATRLQRDSGNTSTTDIYFSNSFETVNSIPFAGKTITYSFYARRGANYSHASQAISTYVSTGTGTDQNRITAGYAGANDIINQQTPLTTTWQRFAYTATVPTTSTEIATWFTFTPVGTAGANDWVEITGVQIDIGTYTASTAPTFRRTGGTIQGELAACQRYYYRTTGSSSYSCFGFGTAYSTSGAVALITFPVTMRITPTAIDYANIQFSDIITQYVVSGGFGINQANPNQVMVSGVGMSGLTTYRPMLINTGGTVGGYLGFTSEL